MKERLSCFRCDLLDCEVFEDDGYYEIEGRRICEDCLGAFAYVYFAAHRHVAGWPVCIDPEAGL